MIGQMSMDKNAWAMNPENEKEMALRIIPNFIVNLVLTHFK